MNYYKPVKNKHVEMDVHQELDTKFTNGSVQFTGDTVARQQSDIDQKSCIDGTPPDFEGLIDDIVRLYITEAGEIPLLTAQDERLLAQCIEKAEYLIEIENEWNHHEMYVLVALLGLTNEGL